MFFVYDKDRLISVGIAISVIAILFVMATVIDVNEDVVYTSTNVDKLIPIYSVDTEDAKIALTINCAWNANDIDLILETLSKHNVKATFFMVGDWVEKYKEAVKKISDAGHEIANHSDTHPHVNNLSSAENMQQIQKCSDKIKEITGKGTTLYRAPYGEYNNTVIEAATNSNHIAIQWSIDSLDYKSLTEEQMWQRIEPKLKNGSIILMHNGTENTALSLDGLIKNIKAKGYELVTVSDLIYHENYSIDNNGIQHKNS